MKVFLSWSGALSQSSALVLREWIPSVIQAVDPYVSSEDIDKGARWSTDIAKELEASAFGVLCVTKDNIATPWINFEAGALSKTLDKARVCPFLLGLKRAEVSGPLLQFQSTVFEKDDVYKLLVSLNGACAEEQLEEPRLQKTFEVWWPRLEAELGAVLSTSPVGEGRPERADRAEVMLEEVLELARSQQKILRSPTELLPPEYVASVIESQLDFVRRFERDHPAWRDLEIALRDLEAFVRDAGGGMVPMSAVHELVRSVVRPAEYLLMRVVGRAGMPPRPARQPKRDAGSPD